MKDEHGQNQYAIEPFAPEGDGISDHSAEEWLHDCCRELGINMAMAIQIYAYCDEHPTKAATTKDQNGLEMVKKLNARHRLAWHILISYQANQKTYEDVCASTRIMALVLGFKTAAGADNIAEMGRKLGVLKATLNKPKIIFREKLGLPPEDDERCEAARANMTASRNGQLKK